MEELLANPAVQAGVAPFLSALVAAAALRRTRLLGVAVALAFALVIALTVGYAFEPLTASAQAGVDRPGHRACGLALEVPGARHAGCPGNPGRRAAAPYGWCGGCCSSKSRQKPFSTAWAGAYMALLLNPACGPAATASAPPAPH